MFLLYTQTLRMVIFLVWAALFLREHCKISTCSRVITRVAKGLKSGTYGGKKPQGLEIFNLDRRNILGLPLESCLFHHSIGGVVVGLRGMPEMTGWSILSLCPQGKASVLGLGP